MRNEVTIQDINFALLREQKHALITLADCGKAKECKEHLKGIICLIDHIQDQAVDQGLTEKEVFGEEYIRRIRQDEGEEE